MSYSWGDDTGVSSRNHGGYNYQSARQAYTQPTNSNSSANSRYTRSVNSGKSPVNQKIQSTASNLIVCRIDVTGSNQRNAKIFFDKLPLLYSEAERYLPGLEISFGAVGDAYTDRYPLQIRNFRSGQDLDAELMALYPEGGGGGQEKESYELAAVYDLRCCDIPNAVHPFYFLLCDEGLYPDVNASQVKTHIGIDSIEEVSTITILHQLMQKFKVYILRCAYNDSVAEKRINQQWTDIFGDRVILLPEASRCIDVMLGIIAIQTGQAGNFSTRLSSRQTPTQVNSVMNSLRSINRPSTPSNFGHSTRSKKIL